MKVDGHELTIFNLNNGMSEFLFVISPLLNVNPANNINAQLRQQCGICFNIDVSKRFDADKTP
ncbi:hypothetical protein FCV83_21705 [Enterovibrio norvegicus]|nr:hypothetical protein A1OU_06770 [Enterovibrio norvegicus]TKF29280.1 hypothetical protein FCV83_21705 [Enterovibrio norvegicus]